MLSGSKFKVEFHIGLWKSEHSSAYLIWIYIDIQFFDKIPVYGWSVHAILIGSQIIFKIEKLISIL
jgi:hypothetical protein